MKVLLCTPYLETPDVVSSGIGTWARNIMRYNRLTGNSIDIVPVSFDRHTHIEEYTVRGLRRYRTGIKEVGKSAIKALRRIKTEKPDVIHICTSGNLGFIKDIILARAARKRGIRSIVHLHFGRVPSIIEEKGFEYRLLRKLLSTADMLVTIDRKSYQALSHLGYKNIAYIPNPISDTFLLEVRKQENTITRSYKSAIFVGHVILTKGVVELVEGCSKVEGLSLRIIGKCADEMKEKLTSLAAKREDGKWMNVVGEIPYSQVIKEMLQADALLFPSYTEAFPNVILEAMACGCPIASSNVGAIPEMLDCNGVIAGICYNPQSVEEITQAVNALYADDTYRNQLAEKAKEKVYSTYTTEKIWPQLTNIWENKISLEEIIK
ncbi:MAG: glycosyltransferase family 4 protein [Bacteroidaceae bacterium]|nr:glycosyltransferase family 4 protein [Bacteroidaceae bacterium]